MIYSSCIFETKCPKAGTALFIVPSRFFPQWQAAASLVCPGWWTGGTIRNRRDSGGDAANLFGTFCPKEPGLGRLPNKHFWRPPASQKWQVWPHLPCLPFVRSPKNSKIIAFVPVGFAIWWRVFFSIKYVNNILMVNIKILLTYLNFFAIIRPRW